MCFYSKSKAKGDGRLVQVLQETPLRDNSPLRILQEFNAREEWLLDPGDMLYLPPGVAHWGVAQTECLTYSIGFRSPSIADMLGDLSVKLMTQGYDVHYRDLL